MKNVFFKKVKSVIIVLIFMLGITCVYGNELPEYYVDNETLFINTKCAGDFSRLSFKIKEKYNNIVVQGEMNRLDCIILLFLSKACICNWDCNCSCKLINLSGVKPVEDGPFFGLSKFQHLHNLETFIFPENLKNIEEDFLVDCPNLKNVNLPKNLVRIGKGSFQNCPKLKMEIPSTVEIGERAFLGCPNVVVSRRLDSELSRKSYFSFSSILSWVGL